MANLEVRQDYREYESPSFRRFKNNFFLILGLGLGSVGATIVNNFLPPAVDSAQILRDSSGRGSVVVSKSGLDLILDQDMEDPSKFLPRHSNPFNALIDSRTYSSGGSNYGN